MATEYTLRRADGRPFDSFERVQSHIRELFSSVVFRWTTSGTEKIAVAAAKGISLPLELLAYLPELPSRLEGVAEGNGFHVTFGLGPQEPVSCLYVTPRGNAPELDRGLAAMEKDAGAEFQVAGPRTT